MTPTQRALILHALGLTPRDGVMPRWSDGNRGYHEPADEEAFDAATSGWIYVESICDSGFNYHVTRLGAEAAGVLGRCRREDLGR